MGSLIRRVNEDALTQESHDRIRKAEIETKAANGGRLSREERMQWWSIHGLDVAEEVDALVRQKKLSSAFCRIIRELALISIAQTENREKLEDRIVRLEKPRVRVRAIQETIA